MGHAGDFRKWNRWRDRECASNTAGFRAVGCSGVGITDALDTVSVWARVGCSASSQGDLATGTAVAGRSRIRCSRRVFYGVVLCRTCPCI